MHLQESGEMYLETIYVLSQANHGTRSIDVAEHLGYSKPSVSRAVSLLKNGGYLVMEPDGTLVLTESGSALARKIYERHRVLTQALLYLGVDEQTAQADACKIEHSISDASFEAIKAHLIENTP